MSKVLAKQAVFPLVLSTGALAQVAGEIRDFGPLVLLPGDVLRVTVFRHPDLSGEFAIASDSTIRHVLYRDVKVVGIPLSEVESRLRKSMVGKYFADTLPPLVVEPLLRITVGGEVRVPNLYTLPRETSLSQAIALAGGPTESGRLDRVRLVRNRESRVIDMTNPADTWPSEPIRSGDQIIVLRRSGGILSVLGPIASLVSAAAAIAALVSR
jgi:polysaccharide export outer membrane protein